MSSSPTPPVRGPGGEDLGGPHTQGATPLSPDELDQLIPSYIVTRAELNEAEQDNIVRALGSRKWRRKHRPDALLDDLVLRDLHRDMFSDVWGWAGAYRQTERNIGVDFWRIGGHVRNLVEDAKYWFAPASGTSVDQAAAEFHHRLVQIHPFPNGNGRHSRAISDLLLRAAGADPFTWGRIDLVAPGETRKRYIAALRAADGGDYGLLNDFVRR
jgi:Fic-DOC domain mobile mystery protein B